MRKPFTGALLGVLFGIAIAIVLQRQGIWPLDQLTLFLMPALMGLLGMALLTFGRAGSTTSLVITMVILIPMLVWGALGLGDAGESGKLNGGCIVTAVSDSDDTSVTDTSRGDPFLIEADGGLTWLATSLVPFMDYDWEIHVVLGGIPVVLDDGTEANEAGSQVNGGDVGNVRSYAAERGIDIDLLVGVYEVGGFADICDGFGFVEIDADGLDIPTVVAIVVALIILVILVVLFVRGREPEIISTSSTTVVVDRD